VGQSSHKLSVPHSGENVHWTLKSFPGARTRSRSSYQHAKFGGTRISPAAGVAKNIEFFTGSIPHSAKCQYMLLRGQFWGFSPHGWHAAAIEVKFGTEVCTKNWMASSPVECWHLVLEKETIQQISRLCCLTGPCNLGHGEFTVQQ